MGSYIEPGEENEYLRAEIEELKSQLSKNVYVCTHLERAALDALKDHFCRLGNDPAYYEVEYGESLDALTVDAINAWLSAEPPRPLE